MGTFWLGIIGVVVGGAVTLLSNILLEQFKSRRTRDLDERRKALLKQMLENPPKDTEWRTLSALCGVIGADEATTTRLLIELDARGSETGNGSWALLKDKPLR